MSDESPASQAADASQEETPASDQTDRSSGSRMRARRWTIAHRYSDPGEYGIPELPAWTVCRTESAGLALAADDRSEPFISATHPMRVRR